MIGAKWGPPQYKYLLDLEIINYSQGKKKKGVRFGKKKKKGKKERKKKDRKYYFCMCMEVKMKRKERKEGKSNAKKIILFFGNCKWIIH